MQSAEKWATRSDAWTPQDDERLAAFVLHHIRTGSTQLRAFEEAANELGRTPAACGYRWNGVVRKDYKEEIEAAKRDRKLQQKSQSVAASDRPAGTAAPATITSSDSMRDVIKFLQTYDEQYQRLRQQVETLEAERRALQERIRELESNLARTPAATDAPLTPEQLEEDSRALFAIMERARKLLEEDGARVRSND
ncbi:RsfA family transcriptional regulator [Alicyclobacillus cycloheptanicus]|uniref:Prespore-specific regulator n=1 Tax=Alicyclobacillus cycloheptanicus TaxID=1457 RepID=A0ABT9XKM2_9BACL|nr:RsfA family transcriptional regulator [Alicyclobacillus cycloheptanicus]MDQ0190757.1 prespore-specific regulator [Alicyclobacillus cycloheptanicus]WDL99858.1 RsfA family transcriptional regulator [Alicyclobacillus cycloheptanicus]